MPNNKPGTTAEPVKSRKQQDKQVKYMAAMDRLMEDLNDKQIKFVFSYLGTKEQYATRLKGVLHDDLL
jgi:hypothetical protein